METNTSNPITTTIAGKEVAYRLIDLPSSASEPMKRVEIVKLLSVSPDGQRARFLAKDNCGVGFLITNSVAAKYLQFSTGKGLKMMRSSSDQTTKDYKVNIVF